jgi:hypothetical protein
MSDVVILGILKFLALGVALASTIWGMTQRISTDGDDGRKRLTRSGRIAIWLAIGSFVISAGSYWFETAAKQRHDRAAETRDAAAREQKAQEDARREQRLLQPIDRLFAQVTWEMRSDTPAVAAATSRLAALARAVRADRSLADTLPPGISLGENDLAITPASEFYPTAERDGPLAAAIRSPSAHVSIFARASAAASLETIMRSPPRGLSILGELGDLRFRLTAREWPTLYYTIETGSLWFEAKLASHAIIERTAALLSVPDLEESMLVLDWSDRARPAGGDLEQARLLRASMRVTRLLLRASGRTYVLRSPQLRMMASRTGFPIFVANPVGPPRR